MAEEVFDVGEGGAGFHQVGGEGVSEGVAGGVFFDPGVKKGGIKYVLDGAGGCGAVG